MPSQKLIDRYGRHLNYLRISVTDRCNLQCIYCIPGGGIEKLQHKEILSYEEILRIVRLGVRLGISKVRITGGEPLVRKGIYGFLERLTGIDGLADVSLTTNGVLLKDNIEKIKSAGIKRINVSIDSLNRQKFKKITRGGYLNQVWEGIEQARQKGFKPIKLNVVVLFGINDDEIIDFARLSFHYPFHIRFIEYMPIGTASVNIDRPLLTPEIKKRLGGLGKLMPVEKRVYDGPAERYKFEGAQGEIGFISALSNHFCRQCNRLRLTASGRLRSCLLSDDEKDLRDPIRNGCSDSELADIILQVAYQKPFEHHLAGHYSARIPGQMSAIGG